MKTKKVKDKKGDLSSVAGNDFKNKKLKKKNKAKLKKLKEKTKLVGVQEFEEFDLTLSPENQQEDEEGLEDVGEVVELLEGVEDGEEDDGPSTSTLPERRIGSFGLETTKKLQVKKSKISKIRRAGVTENVEENFMIVPWENSDEWDGVCVQLHNGSYQEVINKIAVWQGRVPSLPVGVEATLFLLEAITYDQKLLRSLSSDKSGSYTEDQARALYSLAIIRYLNHVNHLAAQTLGKASARPSQELAAIMDTPDWLVSLRNDVSHGTRAPSIDLLRMGGNFVLHWLKEKYWKLPGENVANTTGVDPFTILAQDEPADAPGEIGKLLAAFVAVKIYKKRHQYTISDIDIVNLIPSPSAFTSVKTKEAVPLLRKSLRKYLGTHPSVFCDAVSQELVPSPEFYEDFTSIFSKKCKGDGDEVDEQLIFEQLYDIWMPIINMLEAKGKLMTIFGNLCEIMINSENEKMWMITARWIDKMLEIIETSGKKYSKQLVNHMRNIVKHPNIHMQLFLERLFRLTEPRIGSVAIRKLELLVSIWLDSQDETRKKKRSTNVTLFSMTDIEGNDNAMDVDVSSGGQNRLPWTVDGRGEDFWRTVPLGTVF